MASLIFNFGGKNTKTLEKSGVELAIMLAIERLGSAKAVCEAIGVTRNVLQRWRQGARPRSEHMKKLAKAAGISIKWL